MFWWNLVFFHHFQRICNWLLSIFMTAALKSLSENEHIHFSLMPFSWLPFLIQIVLLVPAMMDDIQLNPGHVSCCVAESGLYLNLSSEQVTPLFRCNMLLLVCFVGCVPYYSNFQILCGISLVLYPWDFYWLLRVLPKEESNRYIQVGHLGVPWQRKS